MRIATGSDLVGYELKEAVKKHLEELGHEVMDLGTTDPENPVLFMTAGDRIAEAVQNGKADRGIAICGSGAGVGIVANKRKGVYCVMCESVWAAYNARFINNANMISMGGRNVGFGLGCEIADMFLKTEFHENAPEKRTGVLEDLFRKVQQIEEQNFRTSAL